MSLLAELKRRNVIRMAGLYLVGAWLITQVTGTVLPIFGAPGWVPRTIVIVLAIGFIPALAFAWIFELTPDGIKRDEETSLEKSIAPQTAQRMNRMIIAMLMLALAYFGFDKFVLAPRREAVSSAAKTGSESLIGRPAGQSTSSAAPISDSDPVTAISSKSIAVLPFENLSEDKANGYFADGIQDQILTGLAKIGDLKVISRTSTQKYASRPDNLSHIAKELGVAHILEGSVQRDGNKVRINVQLINAATDSHVWAENYDRTLDDIFAMQSEVAQEIAKQLAANISRGERQALAEIPTKVPAAYDAYLKARALNSLVLQTRQQADATLAAYREAVRLDPDFSLAWAQIARESFRVGWIGLDPSGKLRKEGEAALARTTELAPGSVHTEIARGVHRYYVKRDFAGALAVMDSLKARLPNDADIWMWAGYLSRRLGKFQQSDADFGRARELSPNDANIAYHHGVTLVVTGECERAVRELDASVALSPSNTHALAMKLQCAWAQGNFPQATAYLATANSNSPAVKGLIGTHLFFQRDYKAAIAQLQVAIAGSGDTLIDASMNGYLPARIDWQLNLALSQRLAGAEAQALANYRQVKAEATRALATKPDNRYVETAWHCVLGMAHAGLGEREAAAEQGKLAVSLVPESADRLEGPGWVVYQARILAMSGDAANAVPLLRRLLKTPASMLSANNLRLEPYWDLLRDDPTFKALLATEGQR